MKITFFKIPKHRVFNYKSRYYDADKEELNERIRKIEESEKQQNNDGEYVFKRENINFRKARTAEQKRSETKLPNKRLFIYVAILLFVFALLASVRNFSYLINPENQQIKSENPYDAEKYDWDPNTQIVIVDEDEDVEVTENTNEQ